MGQPVVEVEFVGGLADGMRRTVPLIKGKLPHVIRVPLKRHGLGGVLLEVSEALYRRIGRSRRYEFRGRGPARPC